MDITFTLDVEDHRAASTEAPRHLWMTRRILDWLDEQGVQGTFFVIGRVAEEDPNLVPDIARRGHEVAVHGETHVPLDEITPGGFHRALTSVKHRLEDQAGARVRGYRAPMFSLVPATEWALDVIAECGFEYSASVLPIRHLLYGSARYPTDPFMWPNGLVELPCPVIRRGEVGYPFLAAVWLRTMPWALTRAALAGGRARTLAWTYGHPYDFDPAEPFRVLPQIGRVGSTLIWYRRSRLFDRMGRLLRDRAAPPLASRLAALDRPLPRYQAAA